MRSYWIWLLFLMATWLCAWLSMPIEEAIMPPLSGVYMPPGTITSEIMLLISELFPIKHAMDAFIGVSMYQQGWEDIYLPLAKLLLMTVIFFGVGINLVERHRLRWS